jgi:hypothetical protein
VQRLPLEKICLSEVPLARNASQMEIVSHFSFAQKQQQLLFDYKVYMPFRKFRP